MEKVKYYAEKITARCPACAAEGGDRAGGHFFLNSSTGQWGCAARPGDGEHRKQIFGLIGVRGEPPFQETRTWQAARKNEREQAAARQNLIQATRNRREVIVSRWAWDEYDIWESSPQRIDQPLVEQDPRHFLASLFPQDAVVWTGRVTESGRGSRFADRWKTVQAWNAEKHGHCGPMTTPAIWSPGTLSRSADHVLNKPYVVADFDGFDGIKPKTPCEVEEHLAAARAITRWLAEGLHWRIAAIVATGSKSLHVWFHAPSATVIDSLHVVAEALGMDRGLIKNAEHPVRLPGVIHEKTSSISRVLWLQSPT